MHAPKQYRTRTQCQLIPPKFDQTFLANTDPVGKQAEFHVMDDCVSPEFVSAAIGHVGASGLRFLLCAPPEKISGGKLHAVRTRDSYEHVSILVVHDVSHGILTERVADLLTIDAPGFPRYELPCANERIRCHLSYFSTNVMSSPYTISSRSKCTPHDYNEVVPCNHAIGMPGAKPSPTYSISPPAPGRSPSAGLSSPGAGAAARRW